jgi:uncharacterized protein
VVLIASRALLGQLRRVLSYPKLARVIDQPELLADLIELANVIVTTTRTIPHIDDEPDNRVLEAAVTGSASQMIYGDRHLLRLGSFESIPILRPVAFIT